MTTHRRSISEAVWSFFSSLKLTLVLFIFIVLLSLVGVLLPQGWSEELYRTRYGDGWWRFIKLTGFSDAYHSWWYRLALALLAGNLFICTIERLGGTIRAVFSRRFYTTDEEFSHFSLRRRVTTPVPPERMYAMVRARLRKRLFSVAGARREELFLISASRGSFSRLTAPVIHFGVITVLVGGLVGALFGFSVVIDLAEGDAAQVPRKSFSIRLEDFTIERTPSGQIKDYLSTLAIQEAGRTVLTQTIEVNHPLQYRGIGIYQSSYGEYPREIVAAILELELPDTALVIRAPFQEPTTVPGTAGLTVRVIDFVADFRVSLPDREVYSASWEPRNPAVRVEVARGDFTVLDGWSFLYHPPAHSEASAPCRVTFLGYDPDYYSGLQITSHPGLPVVWVGFGLLCLGLLPVFLSLGDQRVWVRISPGTVAGTADVLVAGSAHRARGMWERTFSAIVGDWERDAGSVSAAVEVE